QIHGPGAHQHLADLQSLLAGIGLRDQEILGADPELARVADVERVLGVDEGGDAARLLRLGDHVQGQRGLAARLRAVDLDDTPSITSGNSSEAADYFASMPRSSTSKTRVAPPGMVGGCPWSPYAMSEGQTRRAFSPTFIFWTPSVQHLITWFSPNSAG